MTAAARTIFAISSGQGRAGIAVIRISGPDALQALQRMARPVPEVRRAALRYIRHPVSGDILDQALVLWFQGPVSETGETVVELHVHGGLAVVRAVLDALAALDGFRLAEPGEFARRAFTNGKIDLTQAEGLADLIDAETELQRRQALRQTGGALERLYDGWRQEILSAQALIEAAIDFSDEGDVSQTAEAKAESTALSVAQAITRHLDDGRHGEIIRSGFRVALIGPPNAGKSSLLNAFANRDVAIVSDEPGTTRDVIEVRLDLGGLAVVFSDTAGLREGGGAIEREGMRRTFGEARQADLVLWLSDASLPEPELPGAVVDAAIPVWPVRNKIDLLGSSGQSRGGLPDAVDVSAVRGDGLRELLDRIAVLARGKVGGDMAAPLTQVRHRRHLELCREALGVFSQSRGEAIELRAEAVRQAGQALGRLTGRIDVEDVLGEIFGRFCIGK